MSILRRADFQKNWSRSAGTVYDSPHPMPKTGLTAGFLNHFMAYYSNSTDCPILKSTAAKALSSDARLMYLRAEQSQPATVLGIGR